jgi:Rps23 Pro-64 3,4-dihydroxylase Tpa1-like proline 4-hydroxylase/glycosyltransferase involved in cell wall biosynthesis
MINFKPTENESAEYKNSNPFPHIVIDNFLQQEILSTVIEEFKSYEDWGSDNTDYSKEHQVNKFFAPWREGGQDMLPEKIKSVLNYLNSEEFLKTLECLTGINNLIPDTTFAGGGMHKIESRGKLSVHVDSTQHYATKKYRRINLLVYLNEIWEDEWGGSLQLWDKDVKTLVKEIHPILNRAVIFNTGKDTYHGHPHPLNTPENISRNSLALYYYTEDNPDIKDETSSSALWKKTPQEEGKYRPTLAFATMCKNEEHIIGKVLDAVAPYIDYLVVADNGSTDRTLEIVREFMNRTGIPGEIYEDEWYGFDVNKNMMMEYVYGKSDYVLHLDADDILDGDFYFDADDMGYDNYLMTLKRGNSTWKATVIYNNRLHWKFCGVAHTIIKCLEKPHVLTGDLSSRGWIIADGVGSRAFDPKKFLYDAERLQKQFWETLIDDPDGLNYRSVFYTAQSYMDYGMMKEALQWNRLYTKLSNTWIEERFEAQMRISRCLISLNGDFNEIKKEMDTAIGIFSDRAEPYYHFGLYCNQIGNFELGYQYLIKAKNISIDAVKLKYILFISDTCYGKFINDELSVSCYWTGRYDEGLKYLNEIINDPDFSHHKERLDQNSKFFKNNMS